MLQSLIQHLQRSDIVRPFYTPTFLFITSQLLREVYYLLYDEDYEIPSKVAIDPEEPSLGRIRADYVAPPHSAASIKRCISRVEGIPALAHANLFADISCDTPLKETHILFNRTDGPGLSPNDPMAIVQMSIESPSISDGMYFIKNRAADIYWNADNLKNLKNHGPTKTVYFFPIKLLPWKLNLKDLNSLQVNKHSPIIQEFKG